MTPAADAMNTMVSEVWEALVGEPIALATASHRDNLLGAKVEIFGEWMGEVTVSCSDVLAERLATLMFGEPPRKNDINDALGELANMLGGNIKAFLPQPCHLSLPVVAPIDPGLRGETYGFEYAGEPLVVRLLQR